MIKFLKFVNDNYWSEYVSYLEPFPLVFNEDRIINLFKNKIMKINSDYTNFCEGMNCVKIYDKVIEDLNMVRFINVRLVDQPISIKLNTFNNELVFWSSFNDVEKYTVYDRKFNQRIYYKFSNYLSPDEVLIKHIPELNSIPLLNILKKFESSNDNNLIYFVVDNSRFIDLMNVMKLIEKLINNKKLDVFFQINVTNNVSVSTQIHTGGGTYHITLRSGTINSLVEKLDNSINNISKIVKEYQNVSDIIYDVDTNIIILDTGNTRIIDNYPILSNNYDFQYNDFIKRIIIFGRELVEYEDNIVFNGEEYDKINLGQHVSENFLFRKENNIVMYIQDDVRFGFITLNKIIGRIIEKMSGVLDCLNSLFTYKGLILSNCTGNDLKINNLIDKDVILNRDRSVFDLILLNNGVVRIF